MTLGDNTGREGSTRRGTVGDLINTGGGGGGWDSKGDFSKNDRENIGDKDMRGWR